MFYYVQLRYVLQLKIKKIMIKNLFENIIYTNNIN